MRWNTKDSNVHVLGGSGGFGYYEHQWQGGDWGDPEEVEPQLKADARAVTTAFAERGTAAGLRAARRRGLIIAAKLYHSIRSETEEELSARLARIRARLATKPLLDDKFREAFVEARLDVVRDAVAKGATPPQAVADRPEVTRRQMPRWLSYATFALSVIALLRTFERQS